MRKEKQKSQESNHSNTSRRDRKVTIGASGNMPQKKKRTYTFRKGQPIPYESGSIAHQIEKTQRELGKSLRPKKRKK
jgi:hypothetical protein